MRPDTKERFQLVGLMTLMLPLYILLSPIVVIVLWWDNCRTWWSEIRERYAYNAALVARVEAEKAGTGKEKP